MNTSETELREVTAQNVSVSDDSLAVDLADGRTITVPLAWFPRLANGTPAERANWRFIGKGDGIHWPDLDERSQRRELVGGTEIWRDSGVASTLASAAQGLV